MRLHNVSLDRSTLHKRSSDPDNNPYLASHTRAATFHLLPPLPLSAAAAQPAGRFSRLVPPVEKKGPNQECKKLAPGLEHAITPAKENGAWGYMADGLKPAAVVRSGDLVNLTVPTASATLVYEARDSPPSPPLLRGRRPPSHLPAAATACATLPLNTPPSPPTPDPQPHPNPPAAATNPQEMIEGDPELEALFRWDESGPAVATRGAFGGAEGQGWNVGPIHVCSAKPGDILQARRRPPISAPASLPSPLPARAPLPAPVPAQAQPAQSSGTRGIRISAPPDPPTRQVDFMSLRPRLSPKDGSAWGVLTSTQTGFESAGQRDIVTAWQARAPPLPRTFSRRRGEHPPRLRLRRRDRR